MKLLRAMLISAYARFELHTSTTSPAHAWFAPSTCSRVAHADRPCLGQRSGNDAEYEWWTYREVGDKTDAVGSALVKV